ncbi:unnamed protein product [Allacma fusca]|uniref:Mitochondrial inner membrane protein Mpv17 n=1 Tax=Allacma fusca TaxID=39272 RepID=A0A8J2PZ13_9HEXA|nr:unnamed protein product [Allacma fusca]
MAKILGVFQRYPMIKMSAQAGGLMAAGDVISQTCVEGKGLKDIDKLRTLRFGCIGSFFVGPTLSRWYGVLDRYIVIKSPGKQALAKMAVDQFGFAPIFIVLFLGVNGITNGKEVSQIKEDVKRDYTTILEANYKIWPAVQIVNFWIIPAHMRVLFVQTFALLWNTYLSWMTNQ